MSTTINLYALTKDGAILAVLPAPEACECGRMVVFIVNRNGKTRCIACDKEYQDGE